jgi:hypothetical protein
VLRNVMIVVLVTVLPRVQDIVLLQTQCSVESKATKELMLPKRRFWKEEPNMSCCFSSDFSIYSSQTKIMDSRTKERSVVCDFAVLFKGVTFVKSWMRCLVGIGPRRESATSCLATVDHVRRLGKEEQKRKSGCSTHFSRE